MRPAASRQKMQPPGNLLLSWARRGATSTRACSRYARLSATDDYVLALRQSHQSLAPLVPSHYNPGGRLSGSQQFAGFVVRWGCHSLESLTQSAEQEQ